MSLDTVNELERLIKRYEKISIDRTILNHCMAWMRDIYLIDNEPDMASYSFTEDQRQVLDEAHQIMFNAYNSLKSMRNEQYEKIQQTKRQIANSIQGETNGVL